MISLLFTVEDILILALRHPILFTNVHRWMFIKNLLGWVVQGCWKATTTDFSKGANVLPRGICKCRPATKLLYALLSIFQHSMGLHSSISRHSGILENVLYFKYNDKMLHFEKDHQDQEGFVLTMLLTVASLPMQVKKQPNKNLKACSICNWNFVPLQSIYKKKEGLTKFNWTVYLSLSGSFMKSFATSPQDHS